MSGTGRDPIQGITSVRRAVRILDIVAERGDVGVTEVAQELGINKSSASRLIATLVDEGMLDRDTGSRRVHLGLGFLRLSAGLDAWVELIAAARPAMLRLSRRFGASVTVVTLSAGLANHIEQMDDPRAGTPVRWTGRSTPLHCSSGGKLLLAFAPAPMRERLLARPMPRLTEATITQRTALEAQLEEIRARGIAVAMGELRPDQNGVSAALRGPDGTVIAALCVSGPPSVVGSRRIPAIEPALREAAAAVSARLGAPPAGT